jgi:hypothetical protein
MTITEITKQWQMFYAMLGGATATLMGLLFVSLALHSNSIHEEENSHFKRLARLTFSNYLILLMLSLQMLVPIASTIQVVIPVAGIAIVGLFWSIYLRNQGLDRSDPNTGFLVRSYRMALVSYLALLLLAYMLQVEIALGLYLILSPVLMLVISSVRNSWGLLMMIRTKSDDLK